MSAAQHYSRVAIALHWLIALAIIGNLIGGLALQWFFESDDPAMKARGLAIIGLHKSLGLTIILLTLLRIGWRLANPPPPLPAHMTMLERRLAGLSHGVFYVLMLVLPLSGWALASTGRGPILWFGLSGVPRLPIAGTRRELFGESHEILAWAMVALLALHLLAALKHHILDRDDVVAGMLPWVRRRHDAVIKRL